jgi:hypothetical protein
VIQTIQSNWSIGLATFIVSMGLAVIGGIVIGEWLSVFVRWWKGRRRPVSSAELRNLYRSIERRDKGRESWN